MIKRTKLVLIPFFLFAAFVGCGGNEGQNGSSGNAVSNVNGISFPGIPSAHAETTAPTTQAPASGVVGESCHTNDPNHICLALKYVAYKDSSGTPTVSQEAAVNNIKQFNKLWGQCNIGFQIDNYSAIAPKESGLSYSTANVGELDDIRKVENDDKTLLVVTTGTWDRSGSLGDTGANAWTAMPGENLYGAVLEKPVATFGNIIAHELGHYLNLDHVSDESNLMNPIIYDGSTTITKSQCTAAREAVTTYWQKMVR